MGCCFSGPNDYSGKAGGDGGGDGVVYWRPKWQADPPMTRAELTVRAALGVQPGLATVG